MVYFACSWVEVFTLSKAWLFFGISLIFGACHQGGVPQRAAPQPTILLVTLDTTRADRVGYEFEQAATPALDDLAAEGVRFDQAYTTAPMTLPAHTSMMTGLYASEHGVRENARFLPEDLPLLSTRIRRNGYATAAFVSAYPLARDFGLARDFHIYDDHFPPQRPERSARDTTDKALVWLEEFSGGPLFLWVHFFDPHHPYSPPEPFFSRYQDAPYLGEIAFMDRELGRLLQAFRLKFQDRDLKIIVVGDHGEGLAEHGEAYHGNLLYQGVVRVPLVIAGNGIQPGRVSEPVSIRKVYHTITAWVEEKRNGGLLAGEKEVVLAEAMKPFLQYGWSPQVMAVEGRLKTIRAAGVEIYDVWEDPGESHNLASRTTPSEATRKQLQGYALPASTEVNQGLSEQQLERLASLGYTASSGTIQQQDGLPNPRGMTHLFADLDRASDLFVAKRYEDAARLFARIREQDPGNPMICLRAAVAHSVLGREEEARRWFERAGKLIPDSVDLRHYLGMHYLRFEQWPQAAQQFEYVLERNPNRLPAMEALAQIREREGRIPEAIRLYRTVAERKPAPALFVRMGRLFMSRQQTENAVWAFQESFRIQGPAFANHLELGVCLLVLEQYREAADHLERVPARHPEYAMALFKRAQVAALLGEPDTRERVATALSLADEEMRALILRDTLLRPHLP